MAIFSPLRALEHFSRASTKAEALSYCMIKRLCRYVEPPAPYYSLNVENRKIGSFFDFLNLIYEAQRACQPHCFLLSCVQFVKYLYLKLKYLAQRGHTHFEGSNKAQK